MSDESRRNSAGSRRRSAAGGGAMSLTFSNDEIEDCRSWAKRLERAEHRGPGDTLEACRHRLSARTGIGMATLARLLQPSSTVTGLAGKAYRGLLLAVIELEGEVEFAVDRKQRLRLKLEDRERREEARDISAGG